MKEQIEALRLAEKNATPGRWEDHNWDQMERPHVVAVALWNGKDHCNGHFDVPCTFENTHFIALARNTVPLLLAEYDSLKLRLSKAERVVEAARKAKEACLCRRFKTQGFDYGENHKHLGKPKPGARWLTPDDILVLALSAFDQDAPCSAKEDV